ncbi:MAG: 3-isopropylmalate dehydratase large subunit [Thaumarchaeota archaeon]|nr:3-isopropylmalate dehydratase large subunit [Nitrososphaerota archaeon]MCY3976206.1 3-isopropylmalate dehydratase large subunit [Nitrososphaerota archaeon]
MNITEKIISNASGKSVVCPNEVLFVRVDKVMLHDVSGPGVIKVFDRLKNQGIKVDSIYDPNSVWVAEDHFVPSPDEISATNIKKLSDFTHKYGIKKHFKYGMGQYGICHTLSHEEALVLPGEVYAGGDSHTNTTGALGAFACGFGHTDIAYILLKGKIWIKVPETIYFKLNGKLPDYVMAKDFILQIIGDRGTDFCTYKTMQFGGDGIEKMPIDERLTLTNMSTEAGAKNSIIEPDQKVVDYMQERGIRNMNLVKGDSNSTYHKILEYDSNDLQPLVAKPFSPQNIAVAHDCSGIDLDKAYIGSCTGAKLEDLAAVSKILKGHKVKIRTEILPSSLSIYKKAMDMGFIKIFLDAGATIGPPTCGACCGAHMGVLSESEVCISTTNRNFPGRMGHPKSKTYLASPFVVAASSLTGKITDPRDLN